MIFVDSNIPMYLVGAEHPNKDAARRLLERAIAEGPPAAVAKDPAVIAAYLGAQA